ncbi:MAG: NUDIX hydrolase [Cellulosilyticaceae bacterium]
MNWLEQLVDYTPYNEQETKDKELILQCHEAFNELLTRKNVTAHLTGSGFILNKSRDKALMIYHNIYQSWSWTGGHADGQEDLLAVALKEAQEETGVKNIKPITTDLIAIDSLPVIAHIKHEKFVSSHLHLSFAYLLEADETDELIIKPDENSGVKWLSYDEVIACAEKEPHIQYVYKKILERAKMYK